ncbi:TetR/AcrR family transcriptional regulator [Aliamphritea hakodatensis]|uniref:TetR/AcrR family transcriptional regulator n=1 Tax=Aliamphritea hakodatensis TaxID=2895352 RepID=UPI0022FD9D8A|nr:TetR/AcrR family transcriptional regulator [Aliamphritea hakodatensis]
MNKQQKATLREAKILYSAREICRDSGIHKLRMPDLARQSDTSTGSLYRHYERREDVITSLARQALDFRISKLSEYCSRLTDPAERLNALLILDFLFNVAHPEAFHSEITCDNPDWWDDVSPQLKDSYQRSATTIAATVQKYVREALPDGDEQGIHLISTGIWSLITGISNVWLVQHHGRENLLSKASDFFTPHLQAFMQGYCPELQLHASELTTLSEAIITNRAEWLWPHIQPTI